MKNDGFEFQNTIGMDPKEKTFFVVYHVEGEFIPTAVEDNRVTLVCLSPDTSTAYNKTCILEEETDDEYWYCEIPQTELPTLDLNVHGIKELDEATRSRILELVSANISARCDFDHFSTWYGRFDKIRSSGIFFAVLIGMFAIYQGIQGNLLLAFGLILFAFALPIVVVLIAAKALALHES